MPKKASDLIPIFSSPHEINDRTDKAMIEGISSTFPIENANYRIEVEDVHADKKFFDHKDEKDAILRSKSLTYPVRGTVKMYDKKTNKLIDTVKNFSLADTYALTGKHTQVYKGNNYNVANLVVLKPGVYTRSRDNGELESSFNTGSGAGLSIILEPETLLFKIRAGGSKSSGLSLFVLLTKVFGLDRATIERYIPKDIVEPNMKDAQGRDTKVINSLYSKMVNKRIQDKSLSIEDKAEALKEALQNSKLDVDTTQTTLGKSFSHITAETILLSCKNIIDIKRGERAEDNRDSLQFKRVLGLPDFISSHFAKGNENVTGPIKNIQRSLDKVDKNDPKIRSVLGAKPFNKVYTNFINNSTLASPPSETNPIESIENVGKATVIGPGYGGIASEKGVPDEARNVDPSHLGILDPSRTPESAMAGIDQRFTMTARRDSEGNMYARVLDRSGKEVYLSSNEMMNSVIGFPDGMRKDGKKTTMTQYKGKFREANKSEVQYWIPAGSDMYTVTTNMVPFFNSNHPGRLTMAGKALPQSLSLKEREEPLVQTVDHTGTPYIKRMAGVFSSTSPVSGTVVEAKEKSIKIKTDDGQTHVEHLVDNLPFNMKGFHDDEPHNLKVGDRVEAGQLLAENNYTRNGNLAIGKNLHVGYIPYKGYNHEDGIVISRSAAESMTSNHASKFDYKVDKTTTLDLNKFQSAFGRKYKPAQLKGFAANGMPKKGRELHYGDIIWPILEEKQQSETDKLLGRLHKTMVAPYRDASLIWDHHEVGKIVDIDFTGKNIRIIVRSEKQLEMGDKITGLHGNKGVVSLIQEDHLMPHSRETGKPLDLLLNPASVTSRINLGQVLETAAGKIAQKTGKPYLVQNYAEENNIKKIRQELDKHGVSDTEEIYDPVTGKTIGSKVLAGPQYILKLDKTVDANYSARSVNGGYDNIGQPTKGGDEGAKSIGYMEFLGLLGSNARKNLKEMGTIKSEGGNLTDQADYWDRYVRGLPLPKPKTTFATKKFFDTLVGSGIDVSHRNGELSISPLTDEAILKRSSGELQNAKAVFQNQMKAEKGGLFDVNITGGLDGTKWSHFKLAEPMVNPIMEDPVVSMLGLKKKQFEDITAGKLAVKRKAKGFFDLIDTDSEKVVDTINVSAIQDMTKKADDSEPVVAGAAFKQMLSDIDTNDEVHRLKKMIPETKSVSKKNALVKRLKYLHGLSKQGYSDPSKAVMLHNLPVIPPNMRPLARRGNSLDITDVNQLYRDFYTINDGVNKLKDETLDFDPVLQEVRMDNYNSVKAIMANGDPTNYKTKKQGLKGLLRQIGGVGGPKTGYFHDKILKKKQDMSGRGTIYAAPDLGFNEAKIPKDQLWTMYEMHIKRDLAKKGYDPAKAKKAYEDKTEAAMASFNKMTNEVPIIINRAPTLMKTNILAMKAIPTEGKTIGLNILHLPGFAADYDGDAMSMHAPITEEAIREAKEKLMSANHLHDARKGYGSPMYAPGHEAILGSITMTKPDTKQKTVKFKTEAEALRALEAGEIQENTPITIG